MGKYSHRELWKWKISENNYHSEVLRFSILAFKHLAFSIFVLFQQFRIFPFQHFMHYYIFYYLQRPFEVVRLLESLVRVESTKPYRSNLMEVTEFQGILKTKWNSNNTNVNLFIIQTIQCKNVKTIKSISFDFYPITSIL